MCHRASCYCFFNLLVIVDASLSSSLLPHTAQITVQQVGGKAATNSSAFALVPSDSVLSLVALAQQNLLFVSDDGCVTLDFLRSCAPSPGCA